MDLNLDKLLSDLHDGIENVIRGHFSTVVSTLETEAKADTTGLVAEAKADLERVVEKLKNAIAPPAPATSEPPTAPAASPALEGPPVGQPASS